MQCTVFYSWQSQLPNATNRTLIMEALELAARAVRDDVSIDARPEVDRDTANVPGSPNIADTIRAKIDAAEIVVCDVSIVQGRDGDGNRVRPMPNANVLIELGYAMKSLGTTDRLVLVMNTAFGEIAELPFDLRQYRPTVYELHEGASNKAAVRKALASKLEATLRDVLKRPSRHAAAVEPPPLEETIATVEAGAANAELRTKRYMERLSKELLELAPSLGEGDRESALLDAIAGTTDLVCDFATLSRVITGVNNVACARALYAGLTPLVARYDVPRGYAGIVRPAEFDFAKFVAHELLVTFTAAAIADERWELLDDVLRREFFADYGTGPRSLSFARISANVSILEDRTRRLQNRASAHADLLNDRHTSGQLSTLVPMADFVDADALLFLRSELIVPSLGAHEYWFPRSAPFLDHRVPSYLVKGENAGYAAGLLKGLGVLTLGDLRTGYAKQSPRWRQFFQRMATPPLTMLTLEKIGTR